MQDKVVLHYKHGEVVEFEKNIEHRKIKEAYKSILNIMEKTMAQEKIDQPEDKLSKALTCMPVEKVEVYKNGRLAFFISETERSELVDCNLRLWKLESDIDAHDKDIGSTFNYYFNKSVVVQDLNFYNLDEAVKVAKQFAKENARVAVINSVEDHFPYELEICYDIKGEKESYHNGYSKNKVLPFFEKTLHVNAYKMGTLIFKLEDQTESLEDIMKYVEPVLEEGLVHKKNDKYFDRCNLLYETRILSVSVFVNEKEAAKVSLVPKIEYFTTYPRVGR